MADEVEVRARAEIDDDGRPAELGLRGQRVRQPVRSRLGGAVDVDLEHAAQGGRVDDHRLHAEPLARQALERGGEGRDHRRERDGVEIGQSAPVEGQQLADRDRKLIGRGRRAARGAPGAGERPVLEEAEGQVRVADIGREKVHSSAILARTTPVAYGPHVRC